MKINYLKLYRQVCTSFYTVFKIFMKDKLPTSSDILIYIYIYIYIYIWSVSRE
jgi:hypothetical protein